MQRQIAVDITTNVYYQNNPKMFLRLLNVLKFSRRAADVVKFDQELSSWITETTPLLKDHIYNIQTKIYWIINNIQDFPKCNTCGKPLTGKNVFRIFNPKYTFCNSFCAQRNPSMLESRRLKRKLRIEQDPKYQERINAKRKETVRKKYGVDFTIQAPEVREHIRQTVLEKYGVDHVLKSPIIKNTIRQTVRRKYGVEFYAQTDECKQKIRKTLMNKYGVQSAMHIPGCKEKIRQTKKQRYGSENYVNVEKIKRTKASRYGDENYVNPEKAKRTINAKLKTNPDLWRERNAKNENTCLQKYGVKSTNQLESVKRKKELACLKHYGVPSHNQAPEVRRKQMSHYLYDQMYFDSKPELSLYIYLKDNHIDFKYQPKVRLEYVFNGKRHAYFPDFIIEGHFVELKGSHMVDAQTGKWICPWDATLNDQYQAKHEYVQSIGVKILYTDYYQKYIDYINEKYGKYYLRQFKCVK